MAAPPSPGESADDFLGHDRLLCPVSKQLLQVVGFRGLVPSAPETPATKPRKTGGGGALLEQGGAGGSTTSGGYHQFGKVYLGEDDLKGFEKEFSERGDARFREAMAAFWASKDLGAGKRNNLRMSAVAAGWALLSQDEKYE